MKWNGVRNKTFLNPLPDLPHLPAAPGEPSFGRCPLPIVRLMDKRSNNKKMCMGPPRRKSL